MNKGRRNEFTNLKHKKRCDVFGFDPKIHYCYKHQEVPCSCSACVGIKFDRNKLESISYDDDFTYNYLE